MTRLLRSQIDPGFPAAEPRDAVDPAESVEGHALQLTGLHKRYGETVAVDEVTLDIRRGEFLTLLGASGSGKTTTLMMIAGFEQPTRGSIVLDGREVASLPPHRRGLGMVFQSYALFPHMTVAQNVAYPLRMRRVGKRERLRRASDALERVQLAGAYGDRHPRELSGGQQQRVALARALVFDPTVLLMDEPLGALDKKLREHMQDEIRRLHRDLGVTIVYVTHDQDEALALSDRIAVMRDGLIEQVDSPKAVYERPESVFVADFVGETNLLSGEIAGVDGDTATVCLDGGQLVYGAMPRPLGVGSRVMIAVRPEKLRLVATEEDATNHVPVTVIEAMYLGSSVRYQASTDAGETVTIRETSGIGSDAVAGIGRRLQLDWASEDAIVLAPAAAGASVDGRRPETA